MRTNQDTLTPSQRETLRQQLENASLRALRESALGALPFLHHVVIDRAGQPCLFRDAAESWQWLLASRIIPAVDFIAGVRPQYNGPRSFWFTMPRGHDKTSFIGRLCSWLLAFSRRPLRCVAAAADREQAGFIAEFMQAEARLNPWLNERLKFATWRVEGASNSKLRVLSADAYSSYGLKEDFMVLDEITQWPKRDLWDAVYSGRQKRPHCVLAVITNAGLLGTWQRDIFEMAKRSSDWYVYESPGQIAGWMPRERVEELKQALPAPLARRLIDNVWIDPAEECGFVTRAEAQLCVRTDLARQSRGRPGVRYVASIDYAPVRDRTCMCVGHEEDGSIILDRMDMLQGSHERRVPIQAVEAWIDDVRKAFFKPTFIVDPYQLESTIQRYEGTVEVERFEARGGKANYELAANLRNLIVNRRIAWYPKAGELLVEGKSEDLVDEFAGVILRTTSYGFRIDAEGTRHDDRVVALGQMALHLVQQARGAELLTGSRWW